MIYTKIGEYKFSKLTLGTVALGMDYGISNSNGQPKKEEGLDILSTAVSLGINTIDTAREYGDAELVTGEFLAQGENLLGINLVTKFRISEENLFHPHRAKTEVYKSLRSSLKHLGLQKLAVFLLHKTMQQPIDAVMEILPPIFDELKNEGLIELAGISVNHPGEAAALLDDSTIRAIQLPFNIFDQRIINNGLLDRLKQENKIVFARSVFLQGLFFMPPESLTGNIQPAKPWLLKLNKLSKESGMTVAQLAFSFVKEVEGITSIVFGATNTQQVRENVDLLHGKSIPGDVKKSVHELFTDLPEMIITPALWALNQKSL